MNYAPDMEYQEQPINIEDLKRKLKDEIPKGIEKAVQRHNDIIESINAFEENLDSLSPYQLSKLELYYNKIQREAWKIAGYYKSQYQYYYGKASTERGKIYIHGRDEHKFTVNDSNFRSKIEEGNNLEISGIYEGYYVTWKGISLSYEGAVNTIKDIMRAVKAEGGQ
jgi:hypothetical protein